MIKRILLCISIFPLLIPSPLIGMKPELTAYNSCTDSSDSYDDETSLQEVVIHTTHRDPNTDDDVAIQTQAAPKRTPAEQEECIKNASCSCMCVIFVGIISMIIWYAASTSAMAAGSNSRQPLPVAANCSDQCNSLNHHPEFNQTGYYAFTNCSCHDQGWRFYNCSTLQMPANQNSTNTASNFFLNNTLHEGFAVCVQPNDKANITEILTSLGIAPTTANNNDTTDMPELTEMLD